MSSIKFRKCITRFGQIPLLLVPVIILGAMRVTAMPGEGAVLAVPFMRFVGCTLFISYIIMSFTKFLYYKDRPEPMVYANRWRKINASSFPSGHTAQATVILCAALFLAAIMYADHMQLGAAVLTLGAVTFYVLIARSRLVLKKHFLIDVIFGTVVGLISVVFAIYHQGAIMGIRELTFSR